MNAREAVLNVVALIFEYAWKVPFQVQFFMFPFTFGHLIWGSIIISVGVHVCVKFISGQKGGWKKDV